jgi:uncharacterized protein (TIGR02453 family)
MALGGRKSEWAGYYLHIEPGGRSMVGGGLWRPEVEVLKEVRRAIYERSEEFVGIVEAVGFREVFGGEDGEVFGGEGGEVLKVMPRGYPKEWVYGKYLRYKSWCVSYRVRDGFFGEAGWKEEVEAVWRRLRPLIGFLNEVVEEVKAGSKGRHW